MNASTPATWPTAAQATTASGIDSAAGATDLEAGFPRTEEIFSWVQYLAGLGHRKTGTPQGRRSAEFIADRFHSFGLQDVTIQPVSTACPTVHEASLVVDGDDVECFWVNATGRRGDVGRFTPEPAAEDAEVVHLGHGWEEDFRGVDVRGKIVVCDIEFLPSTAQTLVERSPRSEVFDPDDSLFEDRNKFDIYSPHNWPDNYFHAQAAGAAGFVGVLLNYMDCYNYNEDYTENGEVLGAHSMHVPAVWVSKADGYRLKHRLQDRMRDGSVTSSVMTGSLRLDVEYELKDALNVTGVLPGDDDDIVLVHSHHDAVFQGAVQDASGVAEVLALAKYFSSQSAATRAKTMMFAATDTHFTGYEAHPAFLQARRDAGQRIVLDLCVEHIGEEIELDEHNAAVRTGYVEPRMVYVSDSSGLLPEVRAAFERFGLARTIFFPVGDPDPDKTGPYVFSPDEVVSDAYYFSEAGIPVVSLLSGPMYLFHPSDTPEHIAVDQLRPVGMALAQIAAAALARSEP